MRKHLIWSLGLALALTVAGVAWANGTQSLSWSIKPTKLSKTVYKRVKLTVSSASALPGAKIQLSWTLHGQVRRVPRLQIYLEGREEATYTRGTSSCTDKAVFATVPVVDIQENFRVGSGNAELQVPADAIHSFTSAHNKIIWAIFVKADVTHMPDVTDEFELLVLPEPLAPPAKS